MSNRGIAPEVVRTLLCLFRSSLGDETQAAAASLHDSQWSKLGQLAKTFGVAPWTLLNLSSASIKAIPESLVSDWKTWERKNRLRVLANWSVTIRVLGLLDSAGIRAVPIKGVALSQQLYGSPWLRPAGDVDVLIERRMIPAAHAAMLGAGFAPKELFSNLSASQWQWLLNNDHEACYRDRQAGLFVELQWRMHGNALLNNLDESWIRGELKELEVIGHKVPALPEPVLYLLVMSHLARSRWCRLIWVLDSWKALQAARTVHTEAELEAIIAKHGATRIHRQFLKLMQHLLEDKRLSQWPPPGFCPPHERTRAWSPLREGWDGLRFQLGLSGSLRYKLSVLRGYLVSKNDFSLIRFPNWLLWLYVPLRVPLYIYRRYSQKKLAGKGLAR